MKLHALCKSETVVRLAFEGAAKEVKLQTLGIAAREAALHAARLAADGAAASVDLESLNTWPASSLQALVLESAASEFEAAAERKFPFPPRPALGDPARGFCATEAELARAEDDWRKRVSDLQQQRSAYIKQQKDALAAELENLASDELLERAKAACRLELAKQFFLEEYDYQVLFRAASDPETGAPAFEQVDEVRDLAPQVFFELLAAYRELEPQADFDPKV